MTRFFLAPVFFVLVALLGASSVGCSTVPPLPAAARDLNTAGARALAMGEIADAEAQLSLATEYSPDFTEAWANLGMLELSRGNLDVAKKHLEHAKDLNEHLPVPHHGLGLISERRERYDEAIENYLAALKVDPGFVPARLNLGNLLFRTGRCELARVEFHKLTLHRPNEVAGWLGFVETLLRLGRVTEAESALVEINTRAGDHPEVRMLIARRQIAKGDLASAANALEALSASPEPSIASRAFAFLAVVHLTRGDRDRGGRAIAEALARDPSSAIAKRLIRF